MSKENVEIVRSILEPLNGANLGAIDWGADDLREILGQAYSGDLELTTLASGVGTGVGAFYEGLDGFVRYLNEWLEPFSEYYVDNLDYIDAGTCVIVPSHQRGIGGGSRIEVELDVTTLYELRAGKIVRVHQYDSTQQALTAAGLAG